MTNPVDSSGISRMLADATAMLRTYQERTAGTEPVEPVEGTGEAADGLVRAVAGPPGQLTSLTLDSRAMRMDSATLAEEIVKAVNAALASLRGQTPETGGTADLGELNEQLKTVQENAGRQLASFTNALVEAQQRLAARGGAG